MNHDMIAQATSTVNHFLLMAQLAESLAAVSAVIIEHKYNYYEGFGSWSCICEHGERRFRVAYDGRDFAVMLEEAIPGLKGRGATTWQLVGSRSVPVPVSHSLPGLLVALFMEAIKA